MKKGATFSADKDAGWGLIYRLNNLWAQVDPKATQGEYDSWNYVLDRIYCNLLYRNDMVVERGYKCKKCEYKFKTIDEKKECPKCRKTSGDKGELVLLDIISVKLSDEDEKVYKFVTKAVKDAKNAKLKAAKPKGDNPKKKGELSLEQTKEKHYQALMMKDIWLRKFMQSLNLYLKEIERDPSKALFGGG